MINFMVAKTAIVISCLLLWIGCKAQNGGQANENNVLKIEHIGTINGVAQILITNKQPCAVDVRVSYKTSDEVINIAGNSGVYPAIGAGVFTVKAKVESVCVNNPDRGWVELQTKAVLAINNDRLLSGRSYDSNIMLLGPNPCRDILMLKLKKGYAKPYHIAIINLLGIRKEQWSNSEELSIDMRTMRYGLYIINVEDDRGFTLLSRKIVKM